MCTVNSAEYSHFQKTMLSQADTDRWTTKVEREELMDSDCESLGSYSMPYHHKVDFVLGEIIQDFSRKLTTPSSCDADLIHAKQAPVTNDRVDKNNGKNKKAKRDNILDLPIKLFFERDAHGTTQLHLAIENDHLDAALWLISRVPEPVYLNVPDGDSLYPLHVAVTRRQAQLVRELVLAGASVHLVTGVGNTPLHLACALGDLNCARALLEPFSTEERRRLPTSMWNCTRPSNDLDWRNYMGKTCLHIAATGGQLELVNWLLCAGADAGTGDGLAGNTALHIAAEHGHSQLAQLLGRQRTSCLDAENYAGLTAYQVALEAHHPRLASELLELGAQPRMRRCSSNSSINSENSEADSLSGVSDSGISSLSDGGRPETEFMDYAPGESPL